MYWGHFQSYPGRWPSTRHLLVFPSGQSFSPSRWHSTHRILEVQIASSTSSSSRSPPSLLCPVVEFLYLPFCLLLCYHYSVRKFRSHCPLHGRWSNARLNHLVRTNWIGTPIFPQTLHTIWSYVSRYPLSYTFPQVLHSVNIREMALWRFCEGTSWSTHAPWITGLCVTSHHVFLLPIPWRFLSESDSWSTHLWCWFGFPIVAAFLLILLVSSFLSRELL